MKKGLKEKIAGITGSVSGAASIFGSWQVCHNICLGIIALLGIIGITLAGMPLAFLNSLAVPLWSIAVVLLFISAWLYFKKRCISNRLLLFNSGLIIAGVPFASLQSFNSIFWIIGGITAIAGISLYLKDRIKGDTRTRKRKIRKTGKRKIEKALEK